MGCGIGEVMGITEVISIVGFFGTIALSINAYFLRGIYSKQIEIELKVTKLIVKEEEKDRRIDELEEARKEDAKEIQKLRDRVHSLEGGRAQLLSHLKEME